MLTDKIIKLLISKSKWQAVNAGTMLLILTITIFQGIEI